MISKIKLWIKNQIPYVMVFTLLLLIIFIFFWQKIIINIKSGEAGVMFYRFQGGTETDHVYTEGIHLIAPWNNMTIYNVRIQTILHEFQVLTNRGLPIDLKLAIRFRPEYEMLGVLHQQVGPDYFNGIVIPGVESVLRKHIGHYNPEDIYINKENILTKIIVSALEKLGQKYVKITDVIIRTVSLPKDIKEAIEIKLVEEQRYQTYTFKLQSEKKEAERKEIEAQGISKYHQIINHHLTNKLLTWQGIEATLKLSESNNSKVIVIGGPKNGLPIIGTIPMDNTKTK